MVDLDAAFAAVNTSKTGKITAAEVQAALALANLSFSLQTCALAVRLHDVDDDGCITRGEFAALHSSLDGLNTAFGELSGAGAGASDDAPGLDLDKTEAALKKVDIELDRPALAAAFSSFDPSKDGNLCASEFIGLALFLRAARAAFRAFDSVSQRTASLVLFYFWGESRGRKRKRKEVDKKKTQKKLTFLNIFSSSRKTGGQGHDHDEQGPVYLRGGFLSVMMMIMMMKRLRICNKK